MVKWGRDWDAFVSNDQEYLENDGVRLHEHGPSVRGLTEEALIDALSPSIRIKMAPQLFWQLLTVNANCLKLHAGEVTKNDGTWEVCAEPNESSLGKYVELVGRYDVHDGSLARAIAPDKGDRSCAQEHHG